MVSLQGWPNVVFKECRLSDMKLNINYEFIQYLSDNRVSSTDQVWVKVWTIISADCLSWRTRLAPLISLNHSENTPHLIHLDRASYILSNFVILIYLWHPFWNSLCGQCQPDSRTVSVSFTSPKGIKLKTLLILWKMYRYCKFFEFSSPANHTYLANFMMGCLSLY